MNLRHIAIVVTCTLALGLAAGAGTPGFELDKDTVAAGTAAHIVFDDPLPTVADERYWITITRADAADSAYGAWQYVEGGAHEVSLPAPRRAGAYEVRLHDGYPRLSHHVVHRQRLTVRKAQPTKQASAAPADAQPIKITFDEPAPSKTNQTGTFEGPRVTWNGAAGDATRALVPEGWTLPDLVRVEAEGKRGHVIVTLTFADDLKKTLRQKERDGEMRGYLVTEIFFDVDGNERTGRGSAMSPDRAGFDMGLEVATGVEIKGQDGSLGAVHGNVSATPQRGQSLAPFVTYDVVDRGAPGTSPTVVRAPSPERGQKDCEIRGRKLIIRVSYEELGLKRRQKVRMCFEDCMISAFDAGRVSTDARLTLK